MSIAQIAVTPETFEPVSPAGAKVRNRSFWRRAWDWLIKAQKRRAEAVVLAHPEWLIDPSARFESASTELPRRTLLLIGY